MSESYEGYVRGTCSLPDTNLTWPLYGVGLENLGRDRTPVAHPLPEPGPDELLARVDACGLCFSDIKVLKLGPEHPRISGRDLASNPVILGHEVALTIVEVGEERAGDYNVGDRFVIQADIWYQGVNLAFGYALHGGLEQYAILGREILDGDDGCYLIPLDPSTGYSEAALAEPWACVECAYRVEHRRGLKEGGLTVIAGGADCRSDFALGALAESAPPGLVLGMGIPEALSDEVARACERWGAEYSEVPPGRALAQIAREAPDGGIDDVVLLDPSADLVQEAAVCLANAGVLCLMIAAPLERSVEIDVGRIHYDGTRYVGAAGLDIGEAYASSRSVRPAPGGKMLVVGAGGPMGQMHVQRALEMADGPALVVASDADNHRLDTIPQRYAGLAKDHGRELVCLNPVDMGEAYDERLADLAPEGFDDVIVLVPIPPVISAAAEKLAPGGMFNMFAGVARGTMARLNVSEIALRNVRYTGTSGSDIEDLKTTIRKTQEGTLAPNRAVAAIGGIEATWDGLEAVQEGRLTGKAVIYPHVMGLPLTKLEDLAEVEPEVASHLDDAGGWTKQAEEALLRRHVCGCPEPDDSRQPSRNADKNVRATGVLAGKVALITGAAQGLGEAIALRLAREGADVCIADINEDGARAVAESIVEQTGQRALGCRMDVTDEPEVEAAIARCVEELGGLDVVVSNAGILISGDTPDFAVDSWRKVMEVNLVGYFIVAKQAARAMTQAGKGGVIIQINSKSGKVGSFKNSAYAASKFGGIGLTQSLALEFAEDGIRVNSVCPGNLLDSPLWVDSLYAQYAQRWGVTEEEVRQRYVDKVPMKRGCTYEDVGNVVVFLASDAASYMTGQAINVTGGQVMH